MIFRCDRWEANAYDLSVECRRRGASSATVWPKGLLFADRPWKTEAWEDDEEGMRGRSGQRRQEGEDLRFPPLHWIGDQENQRMDRLGFILEIGP